MKRKASRQKEQHVQRPSGRRPKLLEQREPGLDWWVVRLIVNRGHIM